MGRGARAFWLNLSIYARRRLVLAIGVVALIALIALVAVPALPCGAPGGDTCPPADDAIRLVPEDTIAYLHINVDPDTDQFANAEQVASRLPLITQQAVGRLLSQLPGPNGTPPDFARDIAPWFGGEAAIAAVPAGATTAEEVQLLEVADKGGAKKFADSIESGGLQKSTYRGVDVQVDQRGLATAMVGGFLAIGRESGVRDVIDAQSGAKGTGSLADNASARAARDALPDNRLADAYLSEDGIARLVASPGGPLATLASVVNPGASTGVAAALVANGDGLELDIRSDLDPERAKAQPGFFSAFSSFVPTLGASLSSDSLGYIGIGDPGKTLKSLLEQASTEEPGLASAVGNLVQRVKKLGDVNLEKDLLPSLGREAAFALEPAPGGGAGTQGSGQPASPTLPISATPFLEFVAAGVDTNRAGQALARLQGPIVEALNSSNALQAPVFGDHKIGDVTARSVRLSPTVDLTYAIVNSLLVIATDPTGVEQIARGNGGLSSDDLFDEATRGLPTDVSLFGYLNLEGLVALGEAAGLAEDPAYATFAPEVRSLQALGLTVQSDPHELATDVRLIVGEPPGGGETGVSRSD
jgi:hypothetical protein